MNMMELQAAMPGLMGGLWITFKVRVVFSYHWRFGAGYDSSLDGLSGTKFSPCLPSCINFFRSSAAATGIALVLFCCADGV